MLDYVKVGLHQRSVADDLLFMAPAMEQFGRRVAECRSSLLDKGLKVNA